MSIFINLLNKIIGIHKKGFDKNYNEGTFLDYPIKEFIAKNYEDKNIINRDLSFELNDNNSKILFDANIKKEKDFKEESPIIFKKYEVIKEISESKFSKVYLGSIITNNEPIAIKVEPIKLKNCFLQNEAYILFQLLGIGIPKVKSFGKTKRHYIMVEPLLSESLFDIYEKYNKRMSLSDICLISIQIIDRIQWVHSKGFIHRDIKPDNFLIGRKDPNIIYLIDFSLSKRYKSSTTGKHIKNSYTGKLIGNIRLASVNALKGREQSRRDDLESIAYMIIFFMGGKLPWQGVTGANKTEKYSKIYNMKKNMKIEELCKGLPQEIIEFTKYVRKLGFEQEPNYDYLRSLISGILLSNNINIDSLRLSWINPADYKYLKNPINHLNRKESPQQRLYRKISNSLKERNNSYESNNSSSRGNGNIVNHLSHKENNKLLDKNEFEITKYKSEKEKSKEELNSLETIFDEVFNFEEIDNIEK